MSARATLPAAARRTPAARARWAVAPAAAVVGVLFAGGLVGALRASLAVSADRGWSEASLSAYRTLLDDPAFRDAVVFSLQIAALATVVSAALAVGLAWVLKGRGTWLRTLTALPVPVPHLVVATIAVVWLAPGGLVDRALGGLPLDLVRDRAGLGVVLVYVVKEAPFLTLLLLAAWRPIVDERQEAAAVFGAGRWQRLRFVVWPALRRPLVTGSVIVFAFTLGAFEVPLAIGPTYPQTLPELALDATKTASLDGRAVAAAALILVSLATIALAAAAARSMRSEE